MTDEERKTRQTISREDLYRQVWETPASRLCAQYGISGRGLKKICDRLNVPSPPRGYWARLAAGQRVKQVPLPDASPGTQLQATITPTPPPSPASAAPGLDPEIAERLHAAHAAAAEITVPETLRRPHPVVAAWTRRRQNEIEVDRRDRARWGRSTPVTKPFSALERRQHRFLSTLFKEAEKRGYKVKGEEAYEVSLEIGRNTVKFKLRERIKQVRRRLTDAERAERYYSHQEWRQDRIATGELIFSLETWISNGLRREWRDGEQPLEDQIAEIVAVLAVAGPILEARRLEAVAAEHRRWEEEKRRSEEKEREDQDRNRWRRLVEYAEAWREAQLVGDFIEALAAFSSDPETLHDEKSIVEWIAWARERRDAYNPLRCNVDDLWADIASVDAWNYRDSH